jgi:hypothetical protein
VHKRGEFAASHFAEPTIAKLLDTVGDGANEEVSADPRWLTPIEPLPLLAQLVRTEVGKGLEHFRQIYLAPTRCSSLWQVSFG